MHIKSVFSYLIPVVILASINIKAGAQCGMEIEQDRLGGCAPSTVTFELKGAQVTDECTWVVRNDTILTGTRLQYIFSETGVYDVSVLVKKSDGTICTLIRKAAVTVTTGPTIKELSVSQTTLCEPGKVSLSVDVAEAVQLDWIIEGENYRNAGSAISHYFHTPGYHDVTIRALDKYGCYSMRTFNSVVYMKYFPQIKISSNPGAGCIPFRVNHIATINPGESEIISYKWFFDGGSPLTSNGKNPPAVLYDAPGEYDVTIEIATKDGCVYSYTKNKAVKAGAAPELAFVADKTTGYTGDTFTISNTSGNAAGTFEWELEEGKIIAYSEKEIKVVFNFSGSFDVSLHYNHLGCGQTVKKKSYIVINPQDSIDRPNPCRGLRALFTMSQEVCAGTQVKLNLANNIPGSRYMWTSDLPGIRLMPSDTVAEPYIMTDEPGTYNIKLVMQNEAGCRAEYNRKLFVYKTRVSFSSPDTFNICAPAFVRFTVHAADADSFFWFFGDGAFQATKSTEIAHLYYANSGKATEGFDVKVVAKNRLGCTDTFIREAYIKVVGPVASFTITSRNKATDSLLASFKNTSINVQEYFFDYGDNTPFDSNLMRPHLYTIKDPMAAFQVFRPKMFVRDEFGCASVFQLPDSLVVYRRPLAAFKTNATRFCSNTPVRFTNTSQFAVKWMWDFNNDGQTDDTSNSPVVSLSPGTYNVKLTAFNAAGTADIYYFPQQIYIYALPFAQFSANRSTVCQNETVSFTAISADKSLQYSWQINETSFSPFSREPFFTRAFSNSGDYDIRLVVRNDNDCIDTILQKAAVSVLDELPPALPEIMVSSWNDEESVTVSWKRLPEKGIQAYALYRSVNGSTSLLYSGGETDTFYRDQITPDNKPSYFLIARDICGLTSEKSEIHSPVILHSAFEAGKGIRLRWTSYEGWSDLQGYRIYRKGIGGKYTLVAEVGPDNTNYLDTKFCTGENCYMVAAYRYAGPLAKSNPSCVQSKFIQEQQTVNLSTVQDNSVKLVWQTTGREKSFIIERYTGESGLMNLYAESSSWIDATAEVDRYSYTYKVKGLDSCGNVLDYVNQANTILLNTRYENGDIILTWNDYKTWPKGVKEYQVQLMQNTRGYMTIGRVNGKEHEFVLKEERFSPENTSFFRILAVEDAPEPLISYSNISEFNPPSAMHIPNAFTPNGDGLNDEFNVIPLSIRESSGSTQIDYRMHIYNRWGAEVFYTNSLEQGWDGTIKGQPAPEGVYTYSIYAVGHDRERYKIKGSLVLTRTFGR